MSDLIEQFNKHFTKLVDEHALTDSSWRVALSGGLDSVVLLHLLKQYQDNVVDLQLKAHHVNHGLSVNASNWSTFCRQLCEQLTIPFTASEVHLNISSRVSLEALARDKRYQAFKEGIGFGEILVTAHHQDDQLETLLLALKRGSGPTGLQGIQVCQAFSTGKLVRPLLIFSREQLVDYAQQNNLIWIEDESNKDEQFDRNFIRQQISPLLKSRWPAVAQSFSRSASLCYEQQQLLNELAEADFQQCCVERLGERILLIEPLTRLTSARRNNLLRYWLKSNGLTYPSQKQLMLLWQEVALAEHDKMPKLQLAEVSIQRYQNALYIVSNQQLEHPQHTFNWSGQDKLWLVENKLAVDFSRLSKELAKQHQIDCCFRQHLPAKLSCLPIARSRSRTVKKLLHEYNVPPWQRDQVVFVFCDGKLWQAVGLWVCDIPDLPNLSLTVCFD